MSIRVVRAGLLTSVQDLGRYRFAHLGISPAGAADSVSFRLANMLVGNDPDTAALEMTLVGGNFVFEQPAVVAITGADMSFQCGRKIGMWQAVELPAGAEISCGPISNGVRSYLAVRGGILVPPELGSASTDFAGRFGGYKGRALKDGDILDVGDSADLGPTKKIRNEAVNGLRETGPLRVTRGLQWDWFPEETQTEFLRAQFTVTQQSNRAGLRLAGRALQASIKDELLTEGVPLGAIQVPSNGQPIVLFVDQQTTGGYPKIASVIAADLHRVGQLRPGDDIRFELVQVSEAISLLRQREKMIAEALA